MKIAIEKLTKLLDLVILVHPDFIKEQEKSKLSVFNKYSEIFSKLHITNLIDVEMKGFLNFKENLHWSNLHRQASNICQDMQQLQKSLLILVDEKVPIADRLNQAKHVHGFGPAIISAILQVKFPDKFGVWNTISEEALESLEIFPKFNKESFGEKYEAINNVLLSISKQLRIDLWTLDSLFWYWSKIIEKLEP